MASALVLMVGSMGCPELVESSAAWFLALRRISSGVLLSVDLMELSRFGCLYEKLLHPFPGDQGIVDLGKFAFDACFEEHDGIVLVLPIVIALEGETRPVTRSFDAVGDVAFAV